MPATRKATEAPSPSAEDIACAVTHATTWAAIPDRIRAIVRLMEAAGGFVVGPLVVGPAFSDEQSDALYAELEACEESPPPEALEELARVFDGLTWRWKTRARKERSAGRLEVRQLADLAQDPEGLDESERSWRVFDGTHYASIDWSSAVDGVRLFEHGTAYFEGGGYSLLEVANVGADLLGLPYWEAALCHQGDDVRSKREACFEKARALWRKLTDGPMPSRLSNRAH